METIIYTLGMVILWVLNLVKGTGLGQTYNVLGITKVLLIALAFVCLLRKGRREHQLVIERQMFYTLVPMVALFVAVSYIKYRDFAATEYLWSYLIVFILAETRPTRNALRLTGLAYALMGLVVMAVYAYTDFMKGWDGNSVAMVGLSSFLIFLIPYYGVRDFQSKVILLVAGAVFGVLFWQTGSRSCIMAAALALLVFFGFVPTKRLFRSKPMQIVVLLVPLLVAAGIALLTTVLDLSELDAWSMENFQKPIFNGRDVTWLQGFEQIRKNLWFGSGYINPGRWHNSALACLTAYGVIGYLLWLNLFRLIILEGSEFSDDVCVAGCMGAFLVVYIQQSVELGLMAPNPNLLPYAMLGLLLGRANYMRENTW